MKVAIAGSRDFDRYLLLAGVLKSFNVTEVISGTARGADSLGEQYAKENNIPIKRFPADWDQYGKSAGYIRNREMAEYCDEAVIFWNGESKGTKNMIELMNKEAKECSIIKYQSDIITNGEPIINDEEW